MQITDITMTITLEIGAVVYASISPNGISRWGADKPDIAATVVATEAMSDALFESDCFVREGA